MKISIGLPFFNSEKTLKDAITSVINQSYHDWELILIDDGSSDKSLIIARSFTDHRIRIYSDGKNIGLAARLNEISHLASGELIARMDADDIMHFGRLNIQAEFLVKNVDCDVVGTSAYIIDQENNITGVRYSRKLDKNIGSVIEKGVFIHPTILGRKEWFLKNPYNITLKRSEDFDLWVRSFDSSSFKNIEEPLLFYREVGLAQKTKYIKTQLEKLKLIRSYYKHYLSLREVLESSLKVIMRIIVYNLADIFRFESLIIKFRSINLSNSEKNSANLLLKRSLL